MKDKIQEQFNEFFGCQSQVLASAPGRLEILGNHTDYNEGFVLSCGVTQRTFFAAAGATTGTICRIKDARDESKRQFDLAEMDMYIPGDWCNYIKGILCELQRRNVDVRPFNGMILSSVPMAAGMASSAALEISVAYALGALFGVSFNPEEWARIGQGAENNFVGANTGLLDQFTAINARRDHLVYTDFRSLNVETLPFTETTVFVVANTGIRHDLTVEYNQRRESCEAAAAILGQQAESVKSLRDVSPARLEETRENLGLLTYRRARHIVGENDRVHRGLETLRRNDLEAFGQLLFESHESSRENFENSCAELDILVKTGRSLPGCLGARLSGGGFGGITIHLVEKAEADRYCERLATAYHGRLGVYPETTTCEIGDCAQVYV